MPEETGTPSGSPPPPSRLLPALGMAVGGLVAGLLIGLVAFDRSKDIARLSEDVKKTREEGDARLAAATANFEKLLEAARDDGRKQAEAAREAARKDAADRASETQKLIGALKAQSQAQINQLRVELERLLAARPSAAPTPSARREPVALFDGKSMDHWQPVGGALENWKVEEGLLVCTGAAGARWISTREEYGDFDLSLDYRVGEAGNSGVFIRVPHHKGDPAYTGMEVQVLDNRAEVYKSLKPWQFTGSLYHAVAPSKDATRPAGEWNHLRIRCQGAIVQVYINGERIVDADMDGVHDPKDKANDLRHRPRKGFIGLQNHGKRLEYRNIVLVPLD